jgi:putative signal transducing protein
MESNLVLIFSSGQPYQTEMAKQMLADHNIQAFLINKQDSAYKFGVVELYVNRDDVIRAKMLIQEFDYK